MATKEIAMHQSIEVVANDAGLMELMRFVDDVERHFSLEHEQEYLLRLSIEEIATNIMKYSYSGPASGPIRVECDATNGVLQVRICDCGAPFDPNDAPRPDLTADLAHRPVGGLGLFLVRELSDELRYHHDPATRWNELTIVKRPEAGDA